ncbi:MAG: type II/IV secretion system ATPase subunit [Candidatus Altiarchaeia archaeon]
MPQPTSNAAVSDADRIKEEVLKFLGKKTDDAQRPQCDKGYSIDHAVGMTTLHMNCEGCSRSASLSDDTCRRQAITKLIENPVDKIEFARRLTTEEYEKDDVEMLKEISDLIVNARGAPFGIFSEECGECASQVNALKEAILESIETDPVKAYRGIDSPVDKQRVHTKQGCKKCASLRISTMKYINKSLQNTKLLERSRDHADDPDIYKKIFTAKTRPFLSESRIVLAVPEGAIPLCKEYEVCNARVRIYRIPSWNEDLYHITPPEYDLRDRPQILEMLMQTREWLLKNSADQIDSTDSSDSTKKKFENLCKIKLLDVAGQSKIVLNTKQIDDLVATLVRCTRGLDVIELLLRDPNINDVYVNSPMETTPVYVKHKDYDDCRTNIYLSEDRGNNFVLKFVLKSGIGLSPNSPILDMDLEDLKTRVSVIAPPLSPDGIAFSLRCKNEIPWTLPMFVENGMISPLGAALITMLVNDQVAMLIVGGRGTGKSSFLGATMASMNPKYRVLTIEDTLELPVPEMNDAGFRVQRMLSKPITTSEGINITADDALRSSLRMGESSIVVGEVRGQEARVLYESIRVGATGNTVLGTIHGRSPRDIFERVVYDLGIPPTSFKSTDAVVVTQRLPLGRRVTEIAELNKDVDIEKIGSGIEAERLFTPLMKYNAEKDLLELNPDFSPGTSQVLNFIAERRGITPMQLWKDIETRSKMYETMVKTSKENDLHEILELKATVDSNKKYITLIDDQRYKDGGRYKNVDYEQAYAKWQKWIEEYVKQIKQRRSDQ